MEIVQKTSFMKKLIIGLALICGVGVGGWYYQTQVGEGIYEYSSSSDKQFIVNLFKENWYWLIHDYSKNFSTEFMLDNRAASQTDSRTFGILNIKAYRIKGEPVGFIAYYPGALYEGWILFLGVDKKFRSRGYARKLMQYAIDDLKKKGCRIIRLNTRTDNTAGRKLYESLGFKQDWTDGAYVIYVREA
ncbi:GNAT family N-acetyltransferase [Candidatus Dependentiae bacterium]|nr:GNAT family N-acetyltransferase [Candidatus Dependentiae bacterium]